MVLLRYHIPTRSSHFADSPNPGVSTEEKVRIFEALRG